MGVGVCVDVGVGVGVSVEVGVGVAVGVWVGVGVLVGVWVGVGVCVEVADGLGDAVGVGVSVGVLRPTILAMMPRAVPPSGFCFESPVCQYAALTSTTTSGKSASATHRDIDLLRKASSRNRAWSIQDTPTGWNCQMHQIPCASIESLGIGPYIHH